MTSGIIFIVASLAILFAVFKFLSWPAFLFGDKNDVDNEQGLLMAFYTRGNALFRVSSGELSGNSYKVFQTAPDPFAASQLSTLTPGATIYALDLDFNTQAHIIGVGKSSAGDHMGVVGALHDYKMEKVDLEGDFGDYFDVFCAPGQQVQTRYVLNPKGMEAFIDYIKINTWEVVGDQMYVIGNIMEALSGDDIVAKSSVFVKAISPAIKESLPGQAAVKHEKSYGEYEGPVLNCPICDKPMGLVSNVHECPNGHGVLIAGRELLQLHAGKFNLDMPAADPKQHGELICPFCKNKLVSSKYLQGKTVIDSCVHCSFRWLDANEVAEVMQIVKS